MGNNRLGKGLTGKQEKFCWEWHKDFNATQSAIRAGYSKKTAHQSGYENIKKPEILARIQEIREELIERSGVTPAMILAEYAKIAFAEIDDYVDFNSEEYLNSRGETKVKNFIKLKDSKEIKKSKLGAIQSVKQEKDGASIKLHNKQSALDKLAQYHDMFAEKEPGELDITIHFDQ